GIAQSTFSKFVAGTRGLGLDSIDKLMDELGLEIRPRRKRGGLMASLRKRGKVWYFRYVDGDGVKREAKGCPDRRVTEEMARAAGAEAARIRARVIDPKELAYRRHDVRPLSDHLDDWHSAMLAKGRTAKHADLSLSRARQVASLAVAERLGDLQPSRIQA